MAPLTDGIENYRDNLSEWQIRELEKYGISRKYRKNESETNTVFSEKCIKEKVDQDKLLKDVESPVKIIQGNNDSSVPLQQSQWASEKLKNAELITLEDDHYFDNSIDKVSQDAINFFKENIHVSEI